MVTTTLVNIGEQAPWLFELYLCVESLFLISKAVLVVLLSRLTCSVVEKVVLVFRFGSPVFF